MAAPVLAACGPGRGPAASASKQPQSMVLSEGAPRFIHTDRALGNGSTQAKLEGTLALGPGSCIGVKTAAGVTSIPAFPSNATLIGGGQSGINVEGHSYLIGQKVSFGGGLMAVGDADKQAIAPCTSEAEVFLVQSFSDRGSLPAAGGAAGLYSGSCRGVSAPGLRPRENALADLPGRPPASMRSSTRRCSEESRGSAAGSVPSGTRNVKYSASWGWSRSSKLSPPPKRPEHLALGSLLGVKKVRGWGHRARCIG